MAEIWKPHPNKQPDVTNLYDMMLIFQEDLYTVWDDQELERRAGNAAIKLARSLREISPQRRQVSLVADIAIVNESEEARILENIGVLGVVDDIYCISIADRLPMSLSLNIEVVNIFEALNPDEVSFAPTQAIVPIRHVNHIKTLAS